MSYGHIERKLKSGDVVVVDGGLVTELARRGNKTAHDPVVWGVRGLLEAPQAVLDVYRDYVLAGADMITAAAFRTNERSLRRVGMDGLSRPLTRFAISLAQETQALFGDSRPIAVAGNLTSVEDCFLPKLSPGARAFLEHKRQVEQLASSGCDLLLLESFPSVAEAVTALSATQGLPKPVWVSLVLEKRETRVLDGTSVSEAVDALLQASRLPDAILFNCCAPERILEGLQLLKGALDQRSLSIPIGAYGNVEMPNEKDPGGPWIRRPDLSPDNYADIVKDWIMLGGARIVGGCCGTTPDDIRAITRMLRTNAWRSPNASAA